jgi:hypothetical protein
MGNIHRVRIISIHSDVYPLINIRLLSAGEGEEEDAIPLLPGTARASYDGGRLACQL